jgi:hypothetical protein
MDLFKKFETLFVNFLFSLFWTYSYYGVIIEERLRPFGASDFVKKLFFINNKKVEPELDKWNCTAVVNMKLDQPKLIEQYEYGNDNDFLSLNCGEYTSPIYLKKCDDYTLSRITYTKPVEVVETSAARFLNIMYFHKRMAEPIKLMLDARFIRVGNEVFSKTFVLRLLSYQYNPGDYVFDDAYELHIMDGKIQKVTLNSTQYLVFTKEWYEIKSTIDRDDSALDEEPSNEEPLDNALDDDKASDEEPLDKALNEEPLEKALDKALDDEKSSDEEVITNEDQK